MNRDEAVRKVAALLRLAERPGTAGEAAASAAKAQELMDRYNIEAAFALDSGPDESVRDFASIDGGELDSTKRLEVWRAILSRGIASLHGCFTFRAHRGLGASLEIVGKPSDVEQVRYLYGWLSRAIVGLVNDHGRGLGPVWRREFCEGAAGEIVARLNANREATIVRERQERGADAHALALVNRALVRTEDASASKLIAYREHHLRAGGARYARQNGSARDAGRAAARSVNLSGGRQLRLGGGQ